MPDSPRPEDSASPPDPHAEKRGKEWTERMHAAKAAKRAAREAAGEDASAAASDKLAGGSESVERLLGIIRNRDARDADVISAARALADLQGAARTVKPTSTQQLEAMSDADLDQLIAQLELAHSLPTYPEAHS